MDNMCYKKLFSEKLQAIQNMNTFKDYFKWIQNTYPNHVLFEYGNTKYNCEYFFHKSDLISDFLEEKLKSLKKGSWIGIKLQNHPLYLAVCWGVLKSGFNILLIDTDISQPSYDSLVFQSGISAVITNEITDEPNNVITLLFDEIIDFKKSSHTKPKSSFVANKMALCSSGTEGTIKISVYSEENFLEAVKKSISGFKNVFLEADIKGVGDKILVSPPFFHIFGVLVLFIYTTVGITIVINKNKSLSDFIENIKNKNVKLVAHVPAILDSLFKFIEGKYGTLNTSNLEKTLGNNLKFFIGAGVSANKKTKKILIESDIRYIDCYGSTESGVISINNIICRNFDSKVKVLKDGKLLNQGYGEIVAGGKGIRNAVIESGNEILKPCTSENDYIRTGDLGEIRDNMIFIEGRNSDIIISQNGENIVPAEIENYFCFLNDNSCQYVVIGMNEFPVLVIHTEKEFISLSQKRQLIEKIRQKNQEIKISKRVVCVYFITSAFPLTSSLKVKKSLLKEQIMTNNLKYEKIILINKGQSKFNLENIMYDLKLFFSEHLNIDFNDIKDDTLVIEELGSNSITIAELFVYTQKKYGIKLSKYFILKSSLSISDIANKIFEETHIL